MHQKIERFIKIYPWYAGLTGDLLFYIAVDTLFLTVVKQLSAAQIVSLSSVSTIACIVLQFPLLWVIRKIGNTASARLGAFFLLLSALLISFGPNYYVIVMGRIFHDMAAVFRSVSFVTLENNLELVDRRQDFIRVRTAANTVYAVLTMLISFVASLMFNMNNYLPMYGCICTCLIGFVLSFFVVDHSGYNRISRKQKSGKVKLQYSKFLVLAIVVYGLFYPLVTSGQSDGKLFIQQQLLQGYDVDATSLIIGAILIVSRIIRVLSNLAFAAIYKRAREKVGVLLPALLGTAIGLMLFGSFIPQIVCKVLVMSAGYVVILFIRDPFRLYIQDVVFENTAKEYHQTLLTMLEFSVKVGTAAMGLGFTFVLLQYPMTVVMAIMFVIAVVEIALSVKLYQLIVTARQAKTAPPA